MSSSLIEFLAKYSEENTNLAKLSDCDAINGLLAIVNEPQMDIFRYLRSKIAKSWENSIVSSLGNKVQHETTGIRGKVIGYGDRQKNNGNYQITLRVELRSYNPIRPVAEDLLSRWRIWNRRKLVYLHHSPKQASDEITSPAYSKEEFQDKQQN